MRTSTRALALSGAVLVLLIMAVLSLVLGSRETEPSRMLAVLMGEGDQFMEQVLAARWPRTVMGAVVGAALAVSGMLIQSVMRNPLGEPGLLGVTMGASASVVTVSALFGAAGGFAAVGAAMPGAVLAVVAVYLLGSRSGSSSVIPLILAGAVVSAVLGAYVQAMILARPEVFDSYRHWMVGSLAGARFDTLWAVLPALLVGVLLALAAVGGLNALALGEDLAAGLGVKVRRLRMMALAAATLLAAAATAAVGPIAFVGLAVPHLVRALVGSDHRWQLPMALLLGAALLLAADVAARIIARPEELMVGVVTAFVGAPFLLAAVRKGKVRG
ncbi:FecCD family ABC transporter permease [Nesterenkonia cremea]|uniref:ABC transporter permease n=1 Tax=Nesterenkonia cremea TaxID=1882340 RepID=A0A917EQA4_9MICC|nr:iron ABC transporter permease [Nesterenkonia cremea]GGE70702.1 ABC transporter permease [Nesterenkonia cremea]